MRPAKVIPDISFRYHRDWGYWFRPNLNIRFPYNPLTRTPAYYLRTNSVGAPCPHEIDAPRSGRQTVLFVGGSFTVGHGVPVEEAFTHRIAAPCRT